MDPIGKPVQKVSYDAVKDMVGKAGLIAVLALIAGGCSHESPTGPHRIDPAAIAWDRSTKNRTRGSGFATDGHDLAMIFGNDLIELRAAR